MVIIALSRSLALDALNTFLTPLRLLTSHTILPFSALCFSTQIISPVCHHSLTYVSSLCFINHITISTALFFCSFYKYHKPSLCPVLHVRAATSIPATEKSLIPYTRRTTLSFTNLATQPLAECRQHLPSSVTLSHQSSGPTQSIISTRVTENY